MVSNLDTDEGLIQSFSSFSGIIMEDLNAIETELSNFQKDYNETIKFFSELNENVSYMTDVYHKYNLHLLWYGLVAGIAILLTIKIISIIIAGIKSYLEFQNYISDWSTFREFRSQQRRLTNNPQLEQAFPLVRRS